MNYLPITSSPQFYESIKARDTLERELEAAVRSARELYTDAEIFGMLIWLASDIEGVFRGLLDTCAPDLDEYEQFVEDHR